MNKWENLEEIDKFLKIECAKTKSTKNKKSE
jgi:hypothetical protein